MKRGEKQGGQQGRGVGAGGGLGIPPRRPQALHMAAKTDASISMLRMPAA